MTWGVLLMAYGTASGPEDVLRYYTHIRHGRPPSTAQLDDLMARYRAIGGVSPLAAITTEQAQGLQRVLDARHGRGAYQVFLGMKHSPPFIADGVSALIESGIDRAVGLVLAPHYSSMSVGSYLHEAQTAMARSGKPMDWHGIKSWAAHPGLIQILVDRIREARQRFSDQERTRLPVIFSAHSLPQRILREKDPYPDELKRTGDLVARQLGENLYTFSWQSAGRTAEPWMGPDILDKLTMMRTAGFHSALICPAGFVSDHLEVLYDLDIQAQQHAAQIGMHIERTRALNGDLALAELLADLVAAAAS